MEVFPIFTTDNQDVLSEIHVLNQYKSLHYQATRRYPKKETAEKRKKLDLKRCYLKTE